jgi:hypothetical protein
MSSRDSVKIVKLAEFTCSDGLASLVTSGTLQWPVNAAPQQTRHYRAINCQTNLHFFKFQHFVFINLMKYKRILFWP